jgi:hypothetical protein
MAGMKQLLFFALRDDLLAMLAAVEQTAPLRYVLMGQSPDAELKSFDRGAQIPNLGRARAESAINCASFLVADPSVSLSARSRMTAGGERFFVDQLINPDTVALAPGGIWNEKILLHGRVATVSQSGPSQDLMRRFKTTIGKQFPKIKAYYVGPGARGFWERGHRLTIAAQSPPEFDLRVS